ncbi:MAG: isoleucine--tRNA ligase [Vampirovibrionales bacterium]|nr:isoleucine--tRNA ligase [Vampirovibrionales bacterium]
MTTPAATDTTKAKSLKDTLNLPQTQFSMRANAAQKEPECQQQWEKASVYAQAQARRAHSDKGFYTLHDGPPYLSAPTIHIGHALNKILKDFVTRYQYQRGFASPYVPGYDGHGLPIENAVVKSLKGGRHSVTPAELRKLCRDFGAKNEAGQRSQFERLGVWGNWEQPYRTTDAAFEAEQIRVFGQLYANGYVYRGLKPVYWCSHCETALADAEVEYDTHTSDSIYVAFKVLEPPVATSSVDQDLRNVLKTWDETSFVIWTTTPWTLPANLALCFNWEIDYGIYQTTAHGKLVLAVDLVKDFSEKTGIECSLLKTFRAKTLESAVINHPFLDRKSAFLFGDHVTTDAGTGVVHTAPGHGMDDYLVCLNHDHEHPNSKLGILSPLNNKGVFNDDCGVPELVGIHYSKANDVVIDILKQKNALLGHQKFEHSYPHCWRCHNPVIYRATDQWFVSMDNNALRKEAMTAIDTVQWIPERGKTRISTMVSNRTDWCISRQRVWGVPIPMLYDAATGDVVFDADVIAHIANLFEVHTSDIWWGWSTDQLLDGLPAEVKTRIGLPARTLVQEMDIMDVWFDSGITHTAVVNARKEELGGLPVALYLEGSDQHRGWFQSSLLTSVMHNGKAPYQRVLTHGFVLDGNGRKMSKSVGNVVDPNKIMSQYGADVLRLWVASVDYTNDVRISDTIISQMVEAYKKIRNTLRFLMSNLYDFDPAQHSVATDRLDLLDRYTLHRLAEVTSTLTEAFDTFAFHKYVPTLQNFCVVDLSQLYLDVTKDILYTYPANHPERRATQTVLFTLLKTLVPMLVPVLPHLAEDIWQHLPEHQRWSDATSGVLLDGPQAKPVLNVNDQEHFRELLELKESVNSLLEVCRKGGQIGSPSETSVWIQALHPEKVSEVEKRLMKKLLLVSDLVYSQNGPPAAVLASQNEELYVLPAAGTKCPRCWKHIDFDASTSDSHPCEAVVSKADLLAAVEVSA